jgi:1-acyl-sn-glycerol-3-phosphate acyltransferase
MYRYFIYFLLFFISIITILAIVIPLILLFYITYICLFNVSYIEIDFWHKLHPYFSSWLTRFTNIETNFPVQFEDKGFINPNKQYLYIFYPHGMYAISQICNTYCTKSKLAPYFKNTIHTGHSIFFSIPIIRELTLLFKGFPANREYVDYYLKSGKSVSINPTGLRDVKYCTYKYKNTDILYIKNRKGFIRTAKENNVDIVPIYCWNGQQILRHNNSFNWLTKLIKKFGFAFDCNVFEGLSPTNMVKILSMTFGSMPGSKVYCGKPISVSEKDIETIQEEFIKEIERLFDLANKEHGGEKTLRIL